MPGAGGEQRLIPVGRIGAPHGVRGWVRVDSAARPPESILEFDAWWIGSADAAVRYRVAAGRLQGDRVLVRLEGVEDRDGAVALRHAQIAVPRSALPPLPEDEWYWADLIGLTVRTTRDVELGRVERLFETGANDVLVVQGERERLIPWIPDDVIVEVDPAAGRLVVDWDPDF